MSDWRFDIAEAPKSFVEERPVTVKGKDGETERMREFVVERYIIAASNCGKVTKTRWLPLEERWEYYVKGASPIAWQPWPEHPHTAPMRQPETIQG